jgi:hypothetical protein
MTKYKLLKIQGELSDTVLRADDDTNFNTSIPSDPNNVDYQEYLEWKDAGNTPEAAD